MEMARCLDVDHLEMQMVNFQNMGDQVDMVGCAQYPSETFLLVHERKML
jgi:hypothetical protein